MFSQVAASPVLGSLNSGMQLYRIKETRPEIFSKIKYALHLPQYMSYLITGQAFSDVTSIGCHTNLWDFTKQEYHRWVKEEGVIEKLAPLKSATAVVPAKYEGQSFVSGIGLHDSSAALIPYMMNFDEPFVLLSTGTWSISLNPFNHTPLTTEELEQDCLCYISYNGNPVKASRLFSGNEYEREVKRLAAHYGKSARYFQSMDFKPEVIQRLDKSSAERPLQKESVFSSRSLSVFSSDVEAYHQLMFDLVAQQFQSTQLIVKGSPVKRIFVDGGFSKNMVFMNLLSRFFPDLEVYAASLAHGTALGAALAIHSSWNSSPMPSNLIALTLFGKQEVEAGL
jgi:sugar (pentulose or hexulose) kinase